MTAAFRLYRHSMHVDQQWSDMDQYARDQWFADHGDAIARSRGAVINALAEHAALIAKTKAHDDRHGFSAERYVNDVIDSMDAALAPEVVAWLEG